MVNTLSPELLSAEVADSLLVCKGKDCAKKQRCAYKNLLQSAAKAEVPVQLISCQGSCTGPTAVVVTKDGPSWFEDLKKPKAQADVIALMTGEKSKPSKRLKKRLLKGKQRKRARKRLAKTLALSSTVRT